MISTKAFMNRENKATFFCPICHKAKTTDVSKYKNVDRAIRVKISCPCGHVYSVLLERRRHLRKGLDLPGFYTFGDHGRGTMTVLDISRSGIRFLQNNPTTLSIGQPISVTFKLDDDEHTLIRRETIVRKIHDFEIGVEFISQEHYDKLGPYLLYKI